MTQHEGKIVQSTAAGDFAKVMQSGTASLSRLDRSRIDLKPDDTRNGLAGLVLIVVKLLHELLERQAIRRMESGSLTEDQIERLGITLMKQAEEIERLRKEFGLEEEDLNIDLGPIGKLF